MNINKGSINRIKPHRSITRLIYVPVLLCCLGILFPGAAVSKTLTNMTWLSEHNRNAPIYLLVNGRRLNINQDIEDIISYFRNKEPDLFVLPHQHIGARAAPVCALDLKQNTYKLRSSDPKVELPADLSWSENPF